MVWMLNGVPYSVITVALVGVEMADVDDGTGQKSRSYEHWRDERLILEQCTYMGHVRTCSQYMAY